MIASLGMYDLPPLQAANDRLWAGIRDRLRAVGIGAPEGLTRGDGAYWAAWEAPDLVLSQTCGFPYRARLHGRVTLIGTPSYRLLGCPPGYYRSVFVARAGDTRRTVAEFSGAPFAYNEALSQSGWAAPQTHAAKHGLHFPATV
ncbi:MAG: phosphate/phosphite/phosphonate ABC transporter substrate-binding protein, partial [Paracoccaceae bacterium]